MMGYLTGHEIQLSQPARDLINRGIGWMQSMDAKLPPLDKIVEIAGDWAGRGIVPADAALRGLVYIQGIPPHGQDYDTARMRLLNLLPLGGE